MRSLASFLLLLLAATGGVVAYRTATQHEREIEVRDQQITEQKVAISRLTRSRRIAQAVVVDRFVDEKTGKTMSKVRFVEVDETGKSIATREALIEGEVVYFDALVLKFDSELVSAGDPLKGKSVLLFRRMYGEHQNPKDGTTLDESELDGVPSVYRVRDSISAGEKELWGRFWNLASNPEFAKQQGVRVAQGEAVYTKMEKGMLYELSLDDAGGLNIKPTQIPAALLPQEH